LEVKTLSFEIAYNSYYREIENFLLPGIEILEIGGGRHPSLSNRAEVIYSIVDPDQKELEKAPDDVLKLHGKLEDINLERQYDLILTKMVLEHIEDPEAFHSIIFRILKPTGRVIHFFACRHSLPALFNRILPESAGDFILKLIGNRDLNDSPKYPAYYLKTKGYSNKQVNFFTGLKFNVLKYHSFVGHKYFSKIPGLRFLEKLYTRLLFQLDLRGLSTVALVVLDKEK
jgi:2-polyprenyl-3-methyl-5-hydroxy-6-metoxy-1,4-benzoquinol methylase